MIPLVSIYNPDPYIFILFLFMSVIVCDFWLWPHIRKIFPYVTHGEKTKLKKSLKVM